MAQLEEVTGEARVLIGAGEEELLADGDTGGLFSGFIGALSDATSSVQSYVAAAGVFKMASRRGARSGGALAVARR